MGELVSTFPGMSAIVDGDGCVKAELGDEEGVIVAEVQLDPTRKGKHALPCHGQMWAIPVPWYADMWPMTQAWGEHAYEQNSARKQRAKYSSGQRRSVQETPTEGIIK
jgi:N-carbamoylputrescine amidase